MREKWASMTVEQRAQAEATRKEWKKQREKEMVKYREEERVRNEEVS